MIEPRLGSLELLLLLGELVHRRLVLGDAFGLGQRVPQPRGPRGTRLALGRGELHQALRRRVVAGQRLVVAQGGKRIVGDALELGQIVPTCEENLPGALALAQWAADHSDAVPPSDPGGGSTGGDVPGDTDDPGDDTPGTDPPATEGGDAGVVSDTGDRGPGATDGALDGDALPADYGGDGADGCACRARPGDGSPVAWALFAVVKATRPRRKRG